MYFSFKVTTRFQATAAAHPPVKAAGWLTPHTPPPHPQNQQDKNVLENMIRKGRGGGGDGGGYRYAAAFCVCHASVVIIHRS